MTNKHYVTIQAIAEFDNSQSQVKKLEVIDAKINEIRQEIRAKVRMSAVCSFEKLEYLPINVIELNCEMSLNITLSQEDLKEILQNKSQQFIAELYILSKDVEILERKYYKTKDSLTSCEFIVNKSLEREIDQLLNSMNYSIEVKRRK